MEGIREILAICNQDVLPYLMRRAQENTSVAGQTGRELSLINKEIKRRAGR